MKETLLEKVIAGLFDPREALKDRLRNLTYLAKRHLKGMLSELGERCWHLAEEYYKTYGGVMVLEELVAVSKKFPPDQKEQLDYLVAKIRASSQVTKSQFDHAVSVLRDQREEEFFIKGLSETLNIMETGVTKKGQLIKGYKRAFGFLHSLMDHLTTTTAAAGYQDLRDKSIEGLTDEVTHENSTKTGFTSIDTVTGGGRNGELWLMAGYASDGKSQWLINFVWNAVVNCRRNVVIYTGEMSPVQYKRRLITRHAADNRFNGETLLYTAIKNGNLTDAEKKQLELVVTDFQSNSTYGHALIHPIGMSDTMVSIRRDLEAVSAFRPDILVIDYMGLLPAQQRKGNRREELSETIRAAKMLAQDAFKGEGILVVGAHQVNRTGHDRALEQGYYDLQSLEETAEAEKSPDVVAWLLRTQEMEELNEVKVGVMKNRDGERLQEAILYADYARCYMADLSE